MERFRTKSGTSFKVIGYWSLVVGHWLSMDAYLQMTRCASLNDFLWSGHLACSIWADEMSTPRRTRGFGNLVTHRLDDKGQNTKVYLLLQQVML